MLVQLSETDYLLAPVRLVYAVDLQALQLVFERYRDLHHLDSAAAQRAQGGERVRLRLPFLDANVAEDVPALGALSWVLQEVLAHLAQEVGAVFLVEESLY